LQLLLKPYFPEHTQSNNLSCIDNLISLYPNPSKGLISITSNNNIDEIVILGLKGEKILSLQPNEKFFQILLPQDGLYVALIKINGKVLKKKILIQQ
jgi:hypothetical protein